MPRLSLNLPKPETPWLKTPFILIDHLMPSLKDTELRVLLVLLRRSASMRHQSYRPMILSYRELIRRTGRQSEAVSNAISALRQRGLIHSSRSRLQVAHYKPNKHSSNSEEQQTLDI